MPHFKPCLKLYVAINSMNSKKYSVIVFSLHINVSHNGKIGGRAGTGIGRRGPA